MCRNEERVNKISIVIPCYNEESSLPYFISEIQKIANNMENNYHIEFEFIFVNDGSIDATLSILKKTYF